MKKLQLLLLAGITLFCFSQCAKTGPQGPAGEQGNTGSQGPKGDKGDTGATGATGAKGAAGAKGDKGTTGAAGAKGDKGDPGNANVFYTDWTKRSTWSVRAFSTDDNAEGSVGSSVTVANEWSILNLTAESAVMVYVRDAAHSGKQALVIPDRFWQLGGGKSGTLLLRYRYASSWLTIYSVLVDGTWDYNGYIKNTFLPGLEWRVFVIRGSTKINRSSAPLPDPNNYRAVCAYYGIPE